MKKILYIALVATFAFACQRTDIEQPYGGKSDVAINLAVSVEGGVAMGAPSRNAGVVTNPVDFGTDTMAMYGVNELADGTQSWERAKRTIDTTAATVDADGKIFFSKSKKYYPAKGYLSVYALYPSIKDSVLINDPVGSTVPPWASIKISADPAKQYDIMTGKAEQLTVAQSQKASVVFDHAMAMLKIKVYREEDKISAKVTSIKVHGASTATLADIRKPEFTAMATPIDFVAYNNATGFNVTATTAADAQSVGASMMLFPGASSVDKVTMTIDGQDYTTTIPSTWILKQGSINTLTLRIRKMEVIFEAEWTVSNWAKGEGVDSGLENNGKVIRVSAPLLAASGAPYTGVMPNFADVEIDGNYTHKAVPIASTTNGVFTTQPFNSGSLNNESMYMTAIKLYKTDGTILFEGKMADGTLAGQKIIIDTINSGRLKVGTVAGADFALNLDFGGFGLGTMQTPYMVATAEQLQKVSNFKGKAGTSGFDGTSTNGAVFLQIADIDLKKAAWTPIGEEGAKAFCGRYNGNGYVIRNLNVSIGVVAGLFGAITAPSNQTLKTAIENVTVASGSVIGTLARSGVGGIVGYASGAVEIKNCYNGASVESTGTSVGGIVGSITNATISGCVNAGTVTSPKTLGGIVGQIGAAADIIDCYNIGQMISTAPTNTIGNGGVVGYCGYNTIIKNSYNRGMVTKSPAANVNTGGVLGWVNNKGTMKVEFGNNYYLTGTSEKGVGTNQNTTSEANLTNPYTVKTTAELQGMAGVLGSAWKSDNVAPIMNEGYPVLVWQTELWYNRLIKQ